MKSLSTALIALAASAVTGCASDDLGHGYRLVHVTVVNGPGAFEALAHYRDLYYGLLRLERVGEHDISPTGRYAAFCDHHGHLLLFDRGSLRIRNITDGEYAIPRLFTWDESAGILDVEYYENHAPSRIRLRAGSG